MTDRRLAQVAVAASLVAVAVAALVVFGRLCAPYPEELYGE